MTRQERERIGLDLKALRTKNNLTQVELVEQLRARAKKQTTEDEQFSVGTLQAIERALYEVKDSNIEKVAAFFGTSLNALLEAESPTKPTDPLYAKLKRGHLQIAQDYKDADDDERDLVRMILKDGASHAATALAFRIMKLKPDSITNLVKLVESLEAAEKPPPPIQATRAEVKGTKE